MEADVVLLSVEGGSGVGTYSFPCPECEQTIRKAADKNIVALLLSAGVRVQDTVESPEPRHEHHPAERAFTVDDVIDFHFLLEREDWFARLLQGADS